MSTDFSNVQNLAATKLGAAAVFAGLGIFCELDEEATAEQLIEADAQFEHALATKGIAIVVLSPRLVFVDQVKGSAGNARLVVPIGFCENPQTNRGTADADAVPPRSPANKSARKLVEEGVRALLPEFEFDAQATGDPQFLDGFVAYYLLASRKHVIRAASPG